MLRILIVGNKRSSLTLIDTLLYLIPGVTVVTALNAVEAVEVLGFDKNFDLLFLDSEVPEVEVHHTFQQIRRLHAQIPTIIMSHYSLGIDFQSFFQTGTTQYLQLPYTSQSLLDKIESTLNIRVFDVEPHSHELKRARA